MRNGGAAQSDDYKIAAKPPPFPLNLLNPLNPLNPYPPTPPHHLWYHKYKGKE